MTRLLPPMLGTLTALSCIGAASAQTWRAVGPAPRYGHCLGYAGGHVWLFGGSATLGLSSLRDLWAYDGTRWTEHTPSPSSGPGPRVRAAMVYSVTRGRLVMFGGTAIEALAAPTAETWEFDGQSWQQRTFAVSPPARYAHAMAEDLYRGRIVLFGGFSSPGIRLGDTWEYDGTAWTLRQPQLSPPANAEHAMVFDYNNGTTLSYGGLENRLWSFDGVSWREIVTATRPNRIGHPGMWYDWYRGAVMLLDDNSGPLLPARTLQLQQGTWTVVPTVDAPSIGSGPITFDWARGRAVLFGGHGQYNNEVGADTWEFDGSNWYHATAASFG